MVGAVGNNKIGVTGLNERVEIVICQFMDATGNGWVSDAVQCIDYCITEDAHIMSNSWGGVAPSDALTVGRLAVCCVMHCTLFPDMERSAQVQCAVHVVCQHILPPAASCRAAGS